MLTQFTMPALDLYHNAAKQALIKDGWTITHDPFHLRWGRKDMYVDLGAKKLIIAERSEQKIAVEVKSFLGESELQACRDAIGQFAIYRAVLRRTNPDYVLYLAIRDVVYSSFFEEPIGQILIEDENLKFIVFDAEKEVILQWKN
jgi:XisH protein